MNTFHIQLAPIFLGAQFPKRWLLGLARYKSSLPKPRRLFEGIAEVGLEIALVNVPHRIRALRLPPRALAVTSQETGAAQEGLGSGTIASYSVAIPAAMIANTSCKPGNRWFQKSAPIEHFYRFLCRANFSSDCIRTSSIKRLSLVIPYR